MNRSSNWSLLFVCALAVAILMGCQVHKIEPGQAGASLIQKQPFQPALHKVLRPLDWADPVDSKQKLQAVESLNAIYYYVLATRLSSHGRPLEAVQALERVVELDPDSGYVHYRLAKEYLSSGYLEEGAAMARKAVEMDSSNREAKLLLANLYVTAQKIPEAREIFAELMAEDPDDEEVFLYTVLLDIEERLFVEARKKLQSYIARNPDSALGYFYMGRLAQELAQINEALLHYQKSLSLRPSFSQARTHLALLQEATGDKRGAIESYRWLANQSDAAHFHVRLAELYLEVEDYPAALNAFTNATRQRGDDHNSLVKMALIYFQLRDFDQAIDILSDLNETFPDQEMLSYYLGSAQYEKGAYHAALSSLETVTAASLHYGDALRLRLSSLTKSGQGQSARKLKDSLYQEALSSDSLSETLLTSFLSHKLDVGAFQEGLDLLEAHQSAYPSSQRLRFQRAMFLERQGQWREATSIVEPMLKKEPENPAYLNFLGYVWADNNVRLEQAKGYIHKALERRPGDPYITDSLGWVYFRLGELEKALEILKDAWSLKPDESVVADHIGDVFMALGQFTEAEKFYRKALDLGPDREIDRERLEARLKEVKLRSHASNIGGTALHNHDLLIGNERLREPGTER